MTGRKRNRAVVLTEASAEATQDSAGNPTVTVQGTFSAEGYSQTNTLHLDIDAAHALLEALDNAL